MKTKPSKPSKSKKSDNNKKKRGNDKKKYKIRNWKEYNESLVNRGKITFWISDDAKDVWNKVEKTGKRGAPCQYSDVAVTTCLTIKVLFHLNLRSTEGFVNSLLELMGTNLVSPDYSTLSIRQKTLAVDIGTKKDSENTHEPLHIVVDSSGAKVYGEGEWKVRQHGWGKRRTWRKFHLALDPKSKKIKAVEITKSDVADSQVLPNLLEQIPNPIAKLGADGAYDKRTCYVSARARGIGLIAIPPQKNAKIWQHGNTKQERLARDENLRRIREIGKRAWKKESGYHDRSIAENGVFRFKTIFGDRISARNWPSQQVEMLLKCKILNQLTDMGMPKTEVVEQIPVAQIITIPDLVA